MKQLRVGQIASEMQLVHELGLDLNALVLTPCSFTLPSNVPTVCWKMGQTMIPKDTPNLERKPDIHTL